MPYIMPLVQNNTMWTDIFGKMWERALLTVVF